jgi:uncharacterized integral membrane protein
MSRIGFILLVLIAALTALLFSALNAEHVQIELAFGRSSAPLGVLLVSVFVLGLLVGVLLRGSWVVKLLSERGKLRRALRVAEARARASVASREHGA